MNMLHIDLSPLSPLIADPSISEIMVNAPDRIFVEKGGQLQSSNAKFENAAALEALMQEIAQSCGRTLSKAQPCFDGYMSDGSRVNGVLPPMSPKGPVLTIRKFRSIPFTLTKLIEMGVLSDKGAYFLHAAVQARLNIVISGGTGTGKTTLLSVLASLIPESERLISIEDVSELRIQHPNWIRLETVRGSDQPNISARDCLINALRMRPDRIIVGECRRDETFEMLQAMNTGHDGSLTSIHANTPRDCFSRMESLIMTSDIEYPLAALRRQISNAVDLIVQLRRLREGGRVVHEIVEITGTEQDIITTQPLLTRERSGAKSSTLGDKTPDLITCGLPPVTIDKFSEWGIQLPKNFFDPSSVLKYRPD